MEKAQKGILIVSFSFKADAANKSVLIMLLLLLLLIILLLQLLSLFKMSELIGTDERLFESDGSAEQDSPSKELLIMTQF